MESFDKRVDEWLHYLEIRDRREDTIRDYHSKLKNAFKYLKEGGFSTEPEDITEESLYYLKRVVPGRESTRRAYIMALRLYVRWATGRDITAKADLLWNVTEPDRLFISPKDFERLVKAADTTEKLILALGGLMGLRRFEIAELTYADITYGTLTVHGKGHGVDGKVCQLHVPPVVQEVIDEYTETVRNVIPHPAGDNSGGTILAREGVHHDLVAYQREDISRFMQHLSERTGIKVTPHSLRRFFCTTLSDKGVDLVHIKTLMRHSSVNTTVNCYIKPNTQKLDAIMEDMGVGAF